MNRKLFLIIGALLVVAGLFVALLMFGGSPKHTTFTYPGGDLDVLVADNAVEQTKGLSGTTLDTLGADGMLFVFNDYAERTFWMKGMNYDLDVVWIRDGKVMKVDQNIAAPKAGEEPETMSSAPFKVNMVLELPAGATARYNIVPGHQVSAKGFE